MPVFLKDCGDRAGRDCEWGAQVHVGSVVYGSRDDGRVVLHGVWRTVGESCSDGSADTGFCFFPEGEVEVLRGVGEVRVRKCSVVCGEMLLFFWKEVRRRRVCAKVGVPLAAGLGGLV